MEEITTGKTLLGGKVTVEEAEVRELRKFKQMAEKFLAEHGLKDYFKKAFIHFNNREI